ncbi:MAG: hypothetical protein E7544_04265 [Ruminococcaceae bacterium]|nr:hypothetical protein [Oscillospiraceae bacterium]
MSKLYGGLSELKSGGMDFNDVLAYYSEMPISAFICKTGKIKKKEGSNMARIRNQANLDLRQFTPEALKKIKSISRVANVILPENMSPEFAEVYAGIKKSMIANEMVIPSGACIHNGSSIITKSDVTENSLIICNGLTVIKDIPESMKIRLIVNGCLIKSKDAFVEILEHNGSMLEIDTVVKIINNKSEIKVDKNFLDNIGEKTALVSCARVIIDNSVTDVMLKNKKLQFIACALICANEELHGYIHANSVDVANVMTLEQAKKKYKRKFRW